MKYYLMVSTYRYVLIIVPVDLVTIFLYLMMSVIKITAHKSLSTIICQNNDNNHL